ALVGDRAQHGADADADCGLVDGTGLPAVDVVIARPRDVMLRGGIGDGRAVVLAARDEVVREIPADAAQAETGGAERDRGARRNFRVETEHHAAIADPAVDRSANLDRNEVERALAEPRAVVVAEAQIAVEHVFLFDAKLA